MLSAIGIEPDALQAVVARAQSDDEVASWVLGHADAAIFDEVNRTLSARSVADLDPDRLARLEALHPDYRAVPSGLIFDIIERDDEALFGNG